MGLREVSCWLKPSPSNPSLCLPWAGSWRRAHRACGAMGSECLQPVSLVGTCLSQEQLHLSGDGQSRLSLQAAQTLANFGAGEWLTRCLSWPAQQGLSWYWWGKHRQGEPTAARNPCGCTLLPKALSVPLCYQTLVWFWNLTTGSNPKAEIIGFLYWTWENEWWIWLLLGAPLIPALWGKRPTSPFLSSLWILWSFNNLHVVSLSFPAWLHVFHSASAGEWRHDTTVQDRQEELGSDRWCILPNRQNSCPASAEGRVQCCGIPG